MLRKTLRATTALVLCAALAHAEQQGIIPKNRAALARMLSHGAHRVAAIVRPTARGSEPVHNVAPNLENAIFSNYSKDANAQYISWYGYRVANYSSCYSYSIYHSCYHFFADNAFAFTLATTVTTKKVTVPLFSSNPRAEYQVDIYSSVGGLPGSVLAHSKEFTASDTDLCCTASRTVSIKANLSAGTQYFIGLVGVCCNANGGWNMEDADMSGAAVDYFHWGQTPTSVSYCGSGSPCTSPWHKSTYLPETGAAVLK